MFKMNENTSDAIMFVCIASVFLGWTITSYYENIEELKNERETTLDAHEKGYIQCIDYNKTNSYASPIILWKKQCE